MSMQNKIWEIIYLFFRENDCPMFRILSTGKKKKGGDGKYPI
jgi:hypothetical protein